MDKNDRTALYAVAVIVGCVTLIFAIMASCEVMCVKEKAKIGETYRLNEYRWKNEQ